MAENTKIQWADHTFNPWIGCTKVSEGCKFCYAETQDNHRKWTPEGWGPGKPRKRTSAANWKKPLKWDKEAQEEGVRSRVFCASLADVFDDEVPQEWRDDLWQLVQATPNLDWLLLTKRPQNIHGMVPACWFGGEWPANAWLGVTAENQQRADERIPLLLDCPAPVRFLSCEPLLGPLDLTQYTCSFRNTSPDVITIHREIAWVICGGESGPNARRMDPEWALQLQKQCRAERHFNLFSVNFFFKQAGTVLAKEWGLSDRKGGNLDEIPLESLRVREIPGVDGGA